jgi:hypothetical protein
MLVVASLKSIRFEVTQLSEEAVLVRYTRETLGRRRAVVASEAAFGCATETGVARSFGLGRPARRGCLGRPSRL